MRPERAVMFHLKHLKISMKPPILKKRFLSITTLSKAKSKNHGLSNRGFLKLLLTPLKTKTFI